MSYSNVVPIENYAMDNGDNINDLGGLTTKICCHRKAGPCKLIYLLALFLFKIGFQIYVVYTFGQDCSAYVNRGTYEIYGNNCIIKVGTSGDNCQQLDPTAIDDTLSFLNNDSTAGYLIFVCSINYLLTSLVILFEFASIFNKPLMGQERKVDGGIRCINIVDMSIGSNLGNMLTTVNLFYISQTDYVSDNFSPPRSLWYLYPNSMLVTLQLSFFYFLGLWIYYDLYKIFTRREIPQHIALCPGFKCEIFSRAGICAVTYFTFCFYSAYTIREGKIVCAPDCYKGSYCRIFFFLGKLLLFFYVYFGAAYTIYIACGNFWQSINFLVQLGLTFGMFLATLTDDITKS